MRKIFIVIASFGLLASVSFAEAISTGSLPGSKFGSKLQSQLTKNTKRTDYYAQKADAAKVAGKTELAEAYNACFLAKKKSVKSVQDYMAAAESAYSICRNNEALTPIIKNLLTYDIKGEHLKTRIDKLNKYKENCSKEAVTAEKQNKAELATNYKKLSNELDKMAKSLKTYAESQGKFKAEHAKVLNLKKKK